MNSYVTGAMIKKFREEKGMTQSELAAALFISEKTVSKWETGKGYPDITLLEPLSNSLGVSLIELISGNDVRNSNRSANMYRLKFYVCPICGNVITSVGEAVVSCCGVVLPPLEVEMPDISHSADIEIIDDEYYVTVPHDMTKSHYISFMTAVGVSGVEIVKLYPEGAAEARFKRNGVSYILYYCNKHGLYKKSLK